MPRMPRRGGFSGRDALQAPESCVPREPNRIPVNTASAKELRGAWMICCLIFKAAWVDRMVSVIESLTFTVASSSVSRSEVIFDSSVSRMWSTWVVDSCSI